MAARLALVLAVSAMFWILTTSPAAASSESAHDAAAEAVPEFAGTWFDADGILHVMVTDPARFERARAVLARNDEAFAGKAVSAPAKYTYAELREWRAGLDGVQGIAGVVSIHIDQRRNVVVVGTEQVEAAASAVRGEAAERRIPPDAIDVVEASPIGQAPLDSGTPTRDAAVLVAVLGVLALGAAALRKATRRSAATRTAA